MTYQTSRRRFLKTSAAAGIGFWVAGGASAKASNSLNEKLTLGGIGVGGRGTSVLAGAARYGEVIAICDVDDNTLDGIGQRYENAQRFNDFRDMLEAMEGKLDAVTVCTPDHTHAAAAVMAMRMGMACYCEKPLTRTIYEARVLGDVARETGVATQMGNQGTALAGLRRAAAMLKAGVLGTVSEVHVWTNRPIWPQGGERPEPADPPAHLDWDLWIGPSPERPFASGAYHPFAWRGWWDFGSGALGDMACHTMNMPFMGLDLKDPISVQAETSGHNRDSFPAWSRIEYEFAATEDRPALKMIWYDGGRRAPAELLEGREPAGSGCLIIGERGKLYSPDDYGAQFEFFAGAEPIEVEIETSPGHTEEWIEAIQGGKAAVSNFPDYASPQTETVLLGNLAVWADGPKVTWDAKTLTASGAPDLDVLVNPDYREGYSL